MKNHFLFAFAIALLCLFASSCDREDDSYGEFGEYFLLQTRQSSNYISLDLTDMVSDHIRGWGDLWASTKKNKQKKEFINSLKGVLSESPYKMGAISFRKGFVYADGDRAQGYYSCGLKNGILLYFDKEYDKWKVLDFSLFEIKDIIEEYKTDLDSLSVALETRNKEKTVEYKEYVKQDEQVIKAFKDCLSDSQIEEVKSLKKQ